MILQNACMKMLQIPEKRICLGFNLHVPPRILFCKRKHKERCRSNLSLCRLTTVTLSFPSNCIAAYLSWLLSNVTFYKTEENPQGHFFKIGKRAKEDTWSYADGYMAC